MVAAHDLSSEAAGGCSAVLALRVPAVRFTSAVTHRPGGSIQVAHCKVTGVVAPAARFALLLPERWNGGLFMGGGGGFVGTIENDAESTVNAGYATVGTDTGHRGTELQASWALNHERRLLDYGHLAVHRTATAAKAIVRAYYGRNPAHSYFLGCSNGGRQAMMEAQRYPADFDGIVAGAPALDFTGIAAQFVRDTQIAYPDPARLTPLFSRDNLAFLERTILASCDTLDGVLDGVLEDPRRCKLTASSLPACAGDRPASTCFTQAQREALGGLYAPVTSGTRVIRPGQPFGGEGDPDGWQTWITGGNPSVLAEAGMPSLQMAFGTEFFKYLIFNNPAWQYSRYDLATWNTTTPWQRVSAMVDATSLDLASFRSMGHKIVMWHGWSDPAITALGSIDYYERVQRRDPATADFFRLFLMPGVLHCSGGAGPDHADWASAIAGWVERGDPPDRVIATKIANGAIVRARPVCPYPQHAVYTAGNTDAADSFVCRP